jgi:hypothetical protein
MADQKPIRDRLVDFLASQTEERDEMLNLLTTDERRVIAYHWFHVPVAYEYQAKSPEQPFPDRKMQQLRDSAMDKICFWMVERLQADRPTTLAPLPPESN